MEGEILDLDGDPEIRRNAEKWLLHDAVGGGIQSLKGRKHVCLRTTDKLLESCFNHS